YGVTEGPFGPFPIASGNLTITLTDVFDGTCQLVNETVTAPATCSDLCVLSPPMIVATCDDAGTPFDSSDDTYSYTVEMAGLNTGATYSIGGDDSQSGLSYGVVEGPFGPFPVSGGDLTITLTDADDPACQILDEVVGAPAVCSADCQMVIDQIMATPCSGGLHDFSITVSYADEPTMDDIEINVNGAPNIFSSDGSGTQTFSVTGVNCGAPVMVTAQFVSAASCSDMLMYTPIVSPPSDPHGFIYCEETGQIITGGTISVVAPNMGTVVQILQDGSDGEYSFDVLAGPYGDFAITYTPPAGYSLSVAHLPGAGTLDLGTANGGADVTLGQDENLAGTFLDGFNPATYMADNPFYLSVNIEAGDPDLYSNNIPLSGCCVMEMPIITATCDNNGTTDPTDDVFFYRIQLPSNGNSGLSYSISGDDTQVGLAFDVLNGPF
ncbi:MAG: hypothetical protein KDC44_13650, partial [Phaeodactylibacter sp.]|nr:hypothetical protein [Phaeodactylibacter sp.]